jgi:hypothetical protein
MLKKYAAAAVVGGSMLVGAALGVAVFVPHLAGAQAPTTQTPSPARAATNGGGGFSSNEDPAQEGQESPQREADENSGKHGHGHHHCGGHHRGGSNEDPAHEKSESPEREAQENARNGGQSSTQNEPAPSNAF